MLLSFSGAAARGRSRRPGGTYLRVPIYSAANFGIQGKNQVALGGKSGQVNLPATRGQKAAGRQGTCGRRTARRRAAKPVP
jgi:hypothetical protein